MAYKGLLDRRDPPAGPQPRSRRCVCAWDRADGRSLSFFRAQVQADNVADVESRSRDIVDRVVPERVKVLTRGGVGRGVIYMDPALVGVDRSGLPAASFQSALPRVGALAVVVWSPLGFEKSVTAGIVSGLHRSIPRSARESSQLAQQLGIR